MLTLGQLQQRNALVEPPARSAPLRMRGTLLEELSGNILERGRRLF
jgi:hypothetical protein